MDGAVRKIDNRKESLHDFQIFKKRIKFAEKKNKKAKLTLLIKSMIVQFQIYLDFNYINYARLYIV